MSSRSQVQMRQGMVAMNVAGGVAFLAGVVGTVFSFLHWYGVTPTGSATTYLSGWHGWGIPAAILFIVAALIGLGGLVRMSVGPASVEAGLLILAGIAAAMCTIIFMITEGRGYGVGYDKGPLYGAWIGLICAIVIALSGLAMPRDTTG